MLFKALLVTPIAALVSFIFSAVESIDPTVIEQSSLELVILGRIPGTQSFIEFEHILILVVAIAWLPVCRWALRATKEVTKNKIDLITRFDLIAL